MSKRAGMLALALMSCTAAGATNWPGVISSTNNLLTAVNICETTLSAAISASSTTVNVASASCFPDVGYFAIDSEGIYYSSKTSTSFIGVTRAADSTTAASHSNGATVTYAVMAAHHNVLRDELIGMSTFFFQGDLLHISTSSRLVGISTGAPQATLDVNGNLLVKTTVTMTSGPLLLPNGDSTTPAMYFASDISGGVIGGFYHGGSGQWSYGHSSVGAILTLDNTGIVYSISGSAATPILRWGTSGLFQQGSGGVGFSVSGSEKMRLTTTGLKIGFAGNPSTALDVTGIVTATTFSGSGASLTNLPGTQVGSGVPAANIASGSLGASVIASSIAASAVGVAQLSASGSASSANFHRGDNTWSAAIGGPFTVSGGSLTVDNSMLLVGSTFTIAGSTIILGNGKLGIRTLTPSNILEVVCPDSNCGMFKNTSSNLRLGLEAQTDAFFTIDSNKNGGSSSSGYIQWLHNGGGQGFIQSDNSDSNKIKLDAGSTVGSVTGIVINTSHNVGFGTGSPGVHVDIATGTLRVYGTGNTIDVSSGTIKFASATINGVASTYPNAACASGQLLKSDGSNNWSCSADSAGGASALAVATGTSAGFAAAISSPTGAVVFSSTVFVGQLTGSSTAYIDLDADLVDLADGSLTGSKVGSGVPAANIASGSLGTSVIASSVAAASVGVAQMSATGSPSSANFHRGDNVWSAAIVGPFTVSGGSLTVDTNMTVAGSTFTILNGNVGIGTTSAVSPLTVNGTSTTIMTLNAASTSTANGLNGTFGVSIINISTGVASITAFTMNNDLGNTTVLGSAGSNYTGLPVFTNRSIWLAQAISSGIAIMTLGSGDPIVFAPGGTTEKIRFDSNGRVGISTGIPQTALDVQGGVTVSSTMTFTSTTNVGWSVVAVANQACNTTCTYACVFGEDTSVVGSIVDCADATADRCVCGGPN